MSPGVPAAAAKIGTFATDIFMKADSVHALAASGAMAESGAGTRAYHRRAPQPHEAAPGDFP